MNNVQERACTLRMGQRKPNNIAFLVVLHLESGASSSNSLVCVSSCRRMSTFGSTMVEGQTDKSPADSNPP